MGYQRRGLVRKLGRLNKPRHPEYLLQTHVAHYLDAKGLLYTASMPGGINIGPVAGSMKKRAGVKAGCPDIMIFEPHGKYYGLFLELKATEGDIKDEKQLEWQRELNSRGYLAVIMPLGLEFPYNFQWCRDLIEKYCRGEL